MTRRLVSELEGAELDAAVALCGEWKTAHEHFPTMTLDPTFSGVKIINGRCLLMPSNPMRQDAQDYRPSTSWAFGGPIIERERIALYFGDDASGWHAGFNLQVGNGPGIYTDDGQWGPTPLIAAMRSFVASRFGRSVDIP